MSWATFFPPSSFPLPNLLLLLQRRGVDANEELAVEVVEVAVKDPGVEHAVHGVDGAAHDALDELGNGRVAVVAELGNHGQQLPALEA